MAIFILAAALLTASAALAVHLRSGRPRPRVRLLLEPYRADPWDPDALAGSLRALHGLLGSGRMKHGSLALEVHMHRRPDGAPLAWLGVCCPAALETQVGAALRAAFPNGSLRRVGVEVGSPAVLVRLRATVVVARRSAWDGEPPVSPSLDRLLSAMAAAAGASMVQLALRPAPRWIEGVVAERRPTPVGAEPRASRQQIGPLFWGDIIVAASEPAYCHAVAAELRAAGVALRLRAHRPRLARGAARLRTRLDRGELVGPWLALRALYRPQDVALLWGGPSLSVAGPPLLRAMVPRASAPPGISRCDLAVGLLADAHGPVTQEIAVRRQNTAVVGTVEQGKSSFLVASVRADLARERCAVIVLDPKGDAADAAISAVPLGRECLLLDMAHPMCGFNPLAAGGAPDGVADHVLASLRGLFSEGEVKASSDRYLRNALIAALVTRAEATLWDAAMLLSVGADGARSRALAADRLLEFPEHAELARFLGDELPTQLRDARATTTAKLDAPANKLARLINSTAVARILRNDSLRIDFDHLIAAHGVLVVRGALGEVGAGNVAVLMQMLLGMLDAALGRVQDAAGAARGAVALKVDEAPLVINEAFAQTLALKRSAGLETVACWQTDAQWTPALREQLDALFAHRVLFATASAADARAASSLLMAQYADQLRGDPREIVTLAAPDVRLHLPRHTALVSWTTPGGRERPFLARTLPMAVDSGVLARQRTEQLGRGGRELPLQFAHDNPQDAHAAPQFAQAAQPQPPEADPGGEQDGAPLGSPPGLNTVPEPESWQELQAVDLAHDLECLPIPPRSIGWSFDSQSVALLAFIAAARCVLTSQLHRRFHPGQALTTTQRRIKRLADAGLIARLRLARSDGGRVSLCCVPTTAGLEALGVKGRAGEAPCEGRPLGDVQLDLHLVGWLEALDLACGAELHSVLGPGRPVLTPGPAASPGEIAQGGVHGPRDLLDVEGRPVASFSPLRPAAALEFQLVQGGRRDLLVMTDGPAIERGLCSADHLLAGWWDTVPRYARSGVPPLVVFVCRDEARVREVLGTADRLLRATLVELGVSPRRWQRPGRESIWLVPETAAHRGSMAAARVGARPGGRPRSGHLPIRLRADPESRVAWH